MVFRHEVGAYSFKGDPRSRVTRVQFEDLRPGGGNRLNDVFPLSQVASDNSISKRDRPKHTEAGHLIAVNRFAGPDINQNLVPMYAGFNSAGGLWGQFELALESFLRIKNNHADLDIRVNYPNIRTPIPSSFNVTVTRVGGAQVNELCKQIQHTAPAVFHEPPDEDDRKVATKLRIYQRNMEAEGWCVEDHVTSPGIREAPVNVGGIEKGRVKFENPEQKQAFYRGRPYAVLDYLYVKERNVYNEITGPNMAGSFGNTMKFTAEQVDFILYVNFCLSGGYYFSDLYGITALEPVKRLSPGSTDHMPQIDHHFGRGKGGSNTYSNARVISATLNKSLNKKENSRAVERDLYPPAVFG